jgi:hypothetical protein
MTPPPPPTSPAARGRPAAPTAVLPAAVALAVAALLWGAPQVLARAREDPRGATPRHDAHSPSPYPRGAEYPRRVAHPGEFARSAANTGGASPTPLVSAQTPTGKAKKKAPKRKPGLHGDPARALLAYEAMQANFYIPGTGLYEGEPYSYLWPFSQALAATVSVAHISGQAASQASANSRALRARVTGLGRYWSPSTPEAQPLPGEQPEEEEEEPETGEAAEAVGTPAPALPSYSGNVVPPAGVSYYDDNEWVGIELMRLYKLHHEAPMLERAEQIMSFVMSGWQTNPKLACPGGVPFSNSPANTDRNTVTDAPAAELGVQLYQVTGNGGYLQFAQTAYEWVRRCLLSPSGLYFDHIRPHGVIGEALWSYNQGTMIGAGALLYQATGNGAYLYQARQTAKAALAYFSLGRLLSENPFFPAVYFRNLMYLDALTRDPPGGRLAQSYIDSVWVHQRLKSGLFVFGSPPSSQLLVQAAAVQIYALLSTPAATYF